jgi:4-amino-4-deoxy-L-arabinose transferase-like glycosyltransferase
MSHMLDVGAALTQVVVTVLAASAVGAWLLGSRFTFPHPAVRWATCAATGVLILSYTILVLVLNGLATARGLRLLFGLLGLAALAWTALQARRASDGPAASPTAPERASGRVEGREALRTSLTRWPIVAAGGVYGSWMVLSAMLPPAAPDELIHHLAVPRRMLDEGPTVVFVDNIYAYFPALGEMLFLFGLGVAGEQAARLFHAALGGCAALALYGFSRRHLPFAAAWWAVAIFVTVPSVMAILPWAYVDAIFTLYALLAIVLLLDYFDTGQVRWAALSGVMAGGAFATKYTGLPLMLLLTLIVLIDHAWRRRRDMPVAAIVLASAAVVVAAPYLWRNWSLTGWPLFPFAFGPFDLRPGINWDRDREALFLTLLASYGSSASPAGPAGLLDALSAPLLVFVNARFDDPRWYDGVVGPLFLLSPLALASRHDRARLARPALFAALFVLFWALTIRQVRFLIPVLPLLAYFVATLLHRWRSRLAYALAGALLVASAAAGVNRVLTQRPLAYWTGSEPREAFLDRQLAGHAIYQAANRRLGPGDGVYLLNMRSYGYYLRRRWRGDFVFESWRLSRALSPTATAREVARFFTDQEVTHLLIDEGATAASLTAEQQDVFAHFLRDHAALLERIAGHSLYALDGPPAR